MDRIKSGIASSGQGTDVSTMDARAQQAAPDRNEIDDLGPPEVSAEAVARLYNAKIPNNSEKADVAPWIAFIENEAEGIAASWLDSDD